MSDGNAARGGQGATDPGVRAKVIWVANLLLVGLACMTAIGSILVNMDWPSGLGAWVKVLLGGALLAIVNIAGSFVGPAIWRIWVRRRNGDTLEEGLLARIAVRLTWRRIILSLVTTLGMIYIAAVAVPALPMPFPEPELEPGPIKVMTAIDESPNDPRFMLIEQWNAAHPDNKVDIIPVPGEPDDKHKSIINDVTKVRSADVYVLDTVWMPEFIKNEYIRPIDESTLTEFAGDDFLANVKQTCRDLVGGKGGMWALPFNSDAGLLYYRSDLGVTAPKTWDDYFGTSAKTALARVRDTPGDGGEAANLVAANAAQLANEEVLTITALEAMWAAGGEVVTRSGKVVLNEDNSAVVFDPRALNGLKNLAAASQDDDIVHPNSGAADELTSTEAFKDGETLFMRNWPVAYDNLTTPSDKDPISFEIGPLPGPSALGGQNLAISSATKKPKAAQALIEYLTSPSSQLTLFEIGGLAPTRPSAYINSRRPYSQDLRSAVERALPRPVLVHYTEFSAEFRNGIDYALSRNGELQSGFAQRLARIVNKG